MAVLLALVLLMLGHQALFLLWPIGLLALTEGAVLLWLDSKGHWGLLGFVVYLGIMALCNQIARDPYALELASALVCFALYGVTQWWSEPSGL